VVGRTAPDEGRSDICSQAMEQDNSRHCSHSLVGPGRYCLPRHRMLFDSRNDGSFILVTLSILNPPLCSLLYHLSSLVFLHPSLFFPLACPISLLSSLLSPIPYFLSDLPPILVI